MVLDGGARSNGAVALRCNPAVAPAQKRHHARNLRQPHDRPCPADFARQGYDCIRSTSRFSGGAAIIEQKAHLARQLFPGEAQQDAGVRGLQRRDGQVAPIQQRLETPGDSRADSALRIVEKPAPRSARCQLLTDLGSLIFAEVLQSYSGGQVKIG